MIKRYFSVLVLGFLIAFGATFKSPLSAQESLQQHACMTLNVSSMVGNIFVNEFYYKSVYSAPPCNGGHLLFLADVGTEFRIVGTTAIISSPIYWVEVNLVRDGQVIRAWTFIGEKD